jgi:hypothetical protein
MVNGAMISEEGYECDWDKNGNTAKLVDSNAGKAD